MLLLSKDDIKKVYSQADAIADTQRAFELFNAGKIDVPLRTQIKTREGASGENVEGTFLCMPSYCASEDASCVKVLNTFPRNIGNGLATINAVVLVMDTETGLMQGILDGTYVTQLRTAGASGAAIRLLARKGCGKGALIGTGGQAAAQLEALLIAAEPEEVHIFDLNPERAQAFAERMSRELSGYGAKIVAAPSSDAAVDDADVIITVTPSTKPVLDGDEVKTGATVCAVGSYQPHMQEIPASLVKRAAKVYFDSKDAVLAEAGDLIIPLKSGDIDGSTFVADLGDVAAGRAVGRENDEEIVLFETVGIAAQDLIVAQRIFEKAREAGCGTVWEL